MMKITVSPEIEQVCPRFVGACIEADVKNSAYCGPLWDEINQLGEKYRATLTTESLKQMGGIAATRQVYKACGKDPHAIVRRPRRLSAVCCRANNCTRLTHSST